MPQSKTRFTSRRGLNAQKYKEQIAAELKKEHEKLAQETLTKFNEVVADWKGKDKVKFRKRVFSANERRRGFGIYHEGDEHQKGIWEMLDSEGRKGYTIVAKVTEYQTIQGDSKRGSYQARKYMRFQEGYDSRTWPVGQFGGPGERYGSWVRKKVVNMKPLPPRQFSVTIMDDFAREEFLRRSKNAYQRAFDRAKKINK